MDPTSFETHPSRYHHWKLAIDGDGLRFRPMPENEILAPHRAAVRKSKIRTAVVLGAVAAGVAMLGWARHKRH